MFISLIVMFGTIAEFLKNYSDKPLEIAAQARYDNLAIENGRKYMELEVSAVEDGIEYKIPTVVYHF